MSDIMNLQAAFSGKSGVFGTALIPMVPQDLAVYGKGTPVTHWFVVGYSITPDRSFVECYAADAQGEGDIEDAWLEIGARSPNEDFRHIVAQICSGAGLDELIVG